MCGKVLNVSLRCYTFSKIWPNWLDPWNIRDRLQFLRLILSELINFCSPRWFQGNWSWSICLNWLNIRSDRQLTSTLRKAYLKFVVNTIVLQQGTYDPCVELRKEGLGLFTTGIFSNSSQKVHRKRSLVEGWQSLENFYNFGVCLLVHSADHLVET